MSWIESQKPGVDGVNIITSDFVELTDFANVVIKLNNLLLSEKKLKPRWPMYSLLTHISLWNYSNNYFFNLI